MSKASKTTEVKAPAKKAVPTKSVKKSVSKEIKVLSVPIGTGGTAVPVVPSVTAAPKSTAKEVKVPTVSMAKAPAQVKKSISTEEKEQYQEFDELDISTNTIMVYCNITFNLQKVYEVLPITVVDVPLTKKKKLPDVKKIKAPYGTIFSIRYKNDYKGIITKAPSEKASNYFLNQVALFLSLGNKNLHIMVFKDTFKIAGSKDLNQAIEATKLLWSFISADHSTYAMSDIPENKDQFQYPSFIFDTVMTNVDFKLGFQIDRKKLNNLMNDKKYNSIIKMSRFETTGNPNVNIKFYCKKPDNFTYKCMILENVDNPTFRILPENFFDKKKKKKPNYTTFLVFRSSKVIESGKFKESSKNSYNEFINIIKTHQDEIKEKIDDETEYIHTKN